MAREVFDRLPSVGGNDAIGAADHIGEGDEVLFGHVMRYRGLAGKGLGVAGPEFVLRHADGVRVKLESSEVGG